MSPLGKSHCSSLLKVHSLWVKSSYWLMPPKFASVRSSRCNKLCILRLFAVTSLP